MTAYFTSAQKLELQNLINNATTAALNPATAHGAFRLVYDKLYEFLTDTTIVLNSPNYPNISYTPKSFVVHNSWMWVGGARYVNSGEGPFANIIREYTRTEYLIRYGITLTDAQLDNASNEIARRVAQDFIDKSDSGVAPTIDQIGLNDAGGIAGTIFNLDGGSNFAPWAGTFLFASLGQGKGVATANFYAQWVLQDKQVPNAITPDGGYFKYDTGTYDAVAIAQGIQDMNTSVPGVEWWSYTQNTNSELAQYTANLNAISIYADTWLRAYYGIGADDYNFTLGHDTFRIISTGTNTFKSAHYAAGSRLADLINLTPAANGSFVTIEADIVNAGRGDDTVVGTPGTDLLDGGAGSDTLTYANYFNPINATVNAVHTAEGDRSIVRIEKGDINGGDIVYSFEHFVGTSFADTFKLGLLNPVGLMTTSDEVAWQAVLHMDTYSKSIDGHTALAQARFAAAQAIAANQVTFTVDGGAGDDLIMGTRTGNDILIGGDGADSIYAGGFATTIYGGAGNDFIHGGGVESDLYGGAGKDTFFLADNSIVLDASAEDYFVWEGTILSGGVQQWWSESGYAYWSPYGALVSNLGLASIVGGGFLSVVGMLTDVLAMTMVRYGIDADGNLRMEMAGGLLGTSVLEHYKFNPDGVSTAGIEVFGIHHSVGLNAAALKQFINKCLQQAGYVIPSTDPLVIDLNHNGVELTRIENGTFFDIDNDGFAERTAWVSGTDGFLARDLNGNGKIDGQSELFGNASTSGFAALTTLDSTADGMINASDTGFGTLRVWRDLNGNGVTDAGELKTLAETGITSISLATTVPTTTSNAGNTITATSTVTFADATTSTIANVILTNTQIETKYLGDGTVSAAANDNSKFFDHQRCA
jgi:Ca2+-binding RTX toxin-like protein